MLPFPNVRAATPPKEKSEMFRLHSCSLCPGGYRHRAGSQRAINFPNLMSRIKFSKIGASRFARSLKQLP